MIKTLKTNFNYLFFLHVQLGERGSSSVGRAIPCQGIGREFESRLPLQSDRVCFVRVRWRDGRVVMQRPAKP